METRTYWPFKGFFLKLLDEQNGTHLHQDYQKELAEHPPTEEELRRRQELMQASLEEMEHANEEARRREEAAEPEEQREEPDSTVVDQEPMEEQPDRTDDATAENPRTEALVVTELNQRDRVSDLIQDSYKDWNDGMRIIFDAGTNSGKTYFILNVLLPWAKKNRRKILYLCNRTALRDQVSRDVEKLGRKEITYWDYDFERDESVEVTEERTSGCKDKSSILDST